MYVYLCTSNFFILLPLKVHLILTTGTMVSQIIRGELSGVRICGEIDFGMVLYIYTYICIYITFKKVIHDA